MKTMELHKFDAVFAFFCGMMGGIIKLLSGIGGMILLDVGFIGRLFEAGITAIVCGFLGVAGKHLYETLKKKYFKK